MINQTSIHEIAFDPADAKAALSQLPTAPAVFAMYGAEAHAEPYIGRTPNLRGRLERLLQPSEKHPRRLQLAGLVRQIRWRLTGSEFESLLLQFELLEKVYGTKCLERMHLGAPSFVRFLGGNAYPRITGPTAPACAKPPGPTGRSLRAPPPSASLKRPSSSSCCAAAPRS